MTDWLSGTVTAGNLLVYASIATSLIFALLTSGIVREPSDKQRQRYWYVTNFLSYLVVVPVVYLTGVCAILYGGLVVGNCASGVRIAAWTSLLGTAWTLVMFLWFGLQAAWESTKEWMEAVIVEAALERSSHPRTPRGQRRLPFSGGDENDDGG